MNVIKNQKGFTSFELLIVLATVVILYLASLIDWQGSKQQAEEGLYIVPAGETVYWRPDFITITGEPGCPVSCIKILFHEGYLGIEAAVRPAPDLLPPSWLLLQLNYYEPCKDHHSDTGQHKVRQS